MPYQAFECIRTIEGHRSSYVQSAVISPNQELLISALTKNYLLVGAMILLSGIYRQVK